MSACACSLCAAVALAGLRPSPLHLRLSVPPASAVPTSQAPSHMVDLSALLSGSSGSAGTSSRASGGGSAAQAAAAGLRGSAGGAGAAADVGLKLPGVTGPVWGLHMKVGRNGLLNANRLTGAECCSTVS